MRTPYSLEKIPIMKNSLIIFFTSLIFSGMTAQENEIIAISEDACECMEEIDLETSKSDQYEGINSCISDAILSHQLMQSLKNIPEISKDSIPNASESITGISKDSVQQINIEIVTDKNYKEIEAYSLRNCSVMKRIMASDNTKSESSVSDKKKAIEFYNKGQQYYEAGNYGNAIVEFSKAVKKDKNFVFAWDNLGLSYRKKGQLKEAIKSYEKSLAIDPNGKMPLMNIPVAYEKLTDYDNAIKGYKKLIEFYPDDPEGYYGIGRMFHIKKDYENALENTIKAYLLYQEQNSPYIHDAENNIRLYYHELNERGELEIFNRIAEKYNIKTQE